MQGAGELKAAGNDRRTPLAAAAAAVLMLAVLHLCLGSLPWAPSYYNSYTLQALAWRGGQAWLSGDVPYLELAVYQGRYYVSFPPLPSVPLFFLSFLFGENTPDGALVLLYAALSCAVLCRLLLRLKWKPWQAGAGAVLLCLASSLLPLALDGAVWYQAQVLAFLLSTLAVERMQAGRPLPALLFYALAVGCRPLNVLYGPALIAFRVSALKRQGEGLRTIIKDLAPGFAAGLAVALAYGWYNAVRFGNPLEFGHNFLPEFSTQGGRQFSVAHIGRNLQQYMFMWPLAHTGQGWALRQFGFSLFLANPALAWMGLDAGARLVQRRARPVAWPALTALAQLFILLSHRTFGGYQYGARYAADLIPYVFLYLCAGKPGRRGGALMAVLLAGGLGLALYGSCTILLPR